MALRRIALPLLVVAALAAACGGSEDEDAAVSIEEPIGAPQEGAVDGSNATGSSYGTSASAPSVIKDATVDIEVARNELSAAAQKVVDIATAPRAGGYLVSSVVDLRNGYGFGRVAVKVPAPRFEKVVSDLASIGEITRQQLRGRDLSDDSLTASARVQLAERRLAAALRSLEQTDDAAARFELRQQIADAKGDISRLEGNREYIEAQTTYSTIQVALDGEAPARPPEKPVIERSLATAKGIALGILSAIVLAAGVIVPVGALLIPLWFLGALLLRRLKPRLEA